jgi:hypothetical protein
VSAGVRGVILPPLAGHDAGKLIVKIDKASVFFPWLSGGESRAGTKESFGLHPLHSAITSLSYLAAA